MHCHKRFCPLVCFENDTEYFTIGLSKCFDVMVSRSSLVRLRYFFFFFFLSSPFAWWCLLPRILILLWFGTSIPSVLFIMSSAFLSLQNSIPILCLYILIACIRVPNSFSFSANSLMLSVYIRWLIYFWAFVNL